MKAQFWHAQRIRVVSGWKEKDAHRMLRRYPMLPKKADGELKVENHVAIFTTIEKTDRFLDLGKVAQEMKTFGTRIGVNDFVIIPYGHLSNDLAEVEEAIKILGALAETLGGMSRVALAQFGYDKSLDIHIKRHHYNSGFMEFEADVTVAQLFDVYGKEFLEYMNKTHYPARASLIKRLNLQGRSLDVGCADNSLGLDVGIEISDKMIEVATGRVMKADARNLPFANKEFDNVVYADVVNYLDDKELITALREGSRVGRHLIVINEWPWFETSNRQLKGFFAQHRKIAIPRSHRDIKGIAKELRGLRLKQELIEQIDKRHCYCALKFAVME